jgi:hypothetical protein
MTPNLHIEEFEGHSIITQTDFDGIERVYVDGTNFTDEMNDVDEARRYIESLIASPTTARCEHALRAWQVL